MRKIEVSTADRLPHANPGVAPMLDWIPIGRLVIDDRYQRELKRENWTTIRKIAKNFKWSRFSPVFVAPVEGGLFAIIDGQHRVHAAAMCEVEQVPCQIVQMTVDEQAASFAAVNGMVTKVTSWQIFKAALAAGEEWAVNAASIASAGGAKLMMHNASNWKKQAGEIYGVSGFRKLIEARPREPIIRALSILMSAEGYRDAPEIWDSNVLFPLLQAMTDRPASLNEAGYAGKLEELDIWAIIDKIDAATKSSMKAGLPYSPKKEQLRYQVGRWIDQTFPQPKSLSAAEASL